MHDKYSLSLATGGLFHPESVLVTALYLELKDWQAVRDQVAAQNLLQARTQSSSARICREIVARLKTLNDPMLHLLVETHHQEQGYMLWLAACRRYRFVSDFAVDVLHERFTALKRDLNYEDFDAFFNRKSEWHPELDALRPDTRNKWRRVLFKMLREADLLTVNHSINAAPLSRRLIELISRDNVMELSYFPIFEADVKRMLQ